jgi:D-alanyl-D-alanine carboxypeptidase/D-alanyl-D-alanine-endopeptidase (penicillin-binding protein 4)
MINASVSFALRDAENGQMIFEHNSSKSLSQASVMKLITSATALELLGPDHIFTTTIGYTGKIRKGSRTLEGNIIIKGGGDPSLGSERFPACYEKFMDNWVSEIQKLGIKKIKGRVIADDSYFDYKPVPPKWNWEDMGNYYGAGVYGISIYDNTLKIHFQTAQDGTKPAIGIIEPVGCDISYVNDLTAAGSTDEGYVYSSPYSNFGWITGTIPVNRQDFVLKASIPDPPQMTASLLDNMLRKTGISVRYQPSTVRKLGKEISDTFVTITKTNSPRLADLIEVLNHESVNLYAEHLLKELGKVFKEDGSTSAGKEVVMHFLDSLGIGTTGMFIEDGSGLSPQDAINSAGLSDLLYKMKKNGNYSGIFQNSLPEPGKEGTLKAHFTDPVFLSSMRAKSGSLLRVRSYAGYITARSGKNLVFSIIVNNYSGPSSLVISYIEEILKETILND